MEALSTKDTKTERVCGTCNELKPVDQFYKDGLNSKGEVRYRRDCKTCYKKTRFTERGRSLNGTRK